MNNIKFIYNKQYKYNWAREKDEIRITYGNESLSLKRGSSILLNFDETLPKELTVDNSEIINLEKVEENLDIYINARRVFPTRVYSDYKSSSAYLIIAVWLLVITIGLLALGIISWINDEEAEAEGSLALGLIMTVIVPPTIKYLFQRGDNWVYEMEFRVVK